MDQFFQKRSMVILLSLIWGFGLALLFKKACTNNQCIIVKVPPSFVNGNHMIRDKSNRCYLLDKYDSPCSY